MKKAPDTGAFFIPAAAIYFNPAMPLRSQPAPASDTVPSIFEGLDHPYAYPSKAERFVHLLVDLIVGYTGAFLLLVLLAWVAPRFILAFRTPAPGMDLLANLFFSVLVVFVYTLTEGFTKGHTLGKLFTGSVVLQHSGDRITWRDACLRSLCRLIPFEFLSGFAETPWHDALTDTVVVKKSSLPPVS